MITKAEEEERSRGFIDELLNLCDKWEMHPDEVRIIFVEFNEMLDFLENNQPQKRH